MKQLSILEDWTSKTDNKDLFKVYYAAISLLHSATVERWFHDVKIGEESFCAESDNIFCTSASAYESKKIIIHF